MCIRLVLIKELYYDAWPNKSQDQHECVWKCYCTFHSIVDVKFLAYVLNVTHRFVTQIISYANTVYFIAYVYNNCIVCSSKWTICTNIVNAIGCISWHREGKGRLFRISRNPVRYIHKILEQMCVTTYSYAI